MGSLAWEGIRGGIGQGGSPPYLPDLVPPSFLMDRRTEKLKTLLSLVLRRWSVTKSIGWLDYCGQVHLVKQDGGGIL